MGQWSRKLLMELWQDIIGSIKKEELLQQIPSQASSPGQKVFDIEDDLTVIKSSKILLIS